MPTCFWLRPLRLTFAALTLACAENRLELLSNLFFAVLFQRLAVDAQGGCGAGFQALQADFDAAGITVSIFAIFNAGDRFVDLFDQFAFAIAIAQFERCLLYTSPSPRD